MPQPSHLGDFKLRFPKCCLHTEIFCFLKILVKYSKSAASICDLTSHDSFKTTRPRSWKFSLPFFRSFWQLLIPALSAAVLPQQGWHRMRPQMNIVHYNQEIPNPSMHKLPIRKRERFRKRDASLLVWKEMVMASTFLLHLVVVYGYRSENMPQFLFFSARRDQISSCTMQLEHQLFWFTVQTLLEERRLYRSKTKRVRVGRQPVYLERITGSHREVCCPNHAKTNSKYEPVCLFSSFAVVLISSTYC